MSIPAWADTPDEAEYARNVQAHHDNNLEDARRDPRVDGDTGRRLCECPDTGHYDHCWRPDFAASLETYRQIGTQP